MAAAPVLGDLEGFTRVLEFYQFFLNRQLNFSA